MKRAMVTGIDGFIGRHMAAELERRGWSVSGVDIKRGTDALDLFAERSAPRRYDLVAHCAYHVGGRAAINGEAGNLALNLELDAAMFAWAARTRQRAVLYFSSSAAYPETLQELPEGAGYRLSEEDIDVTCAEEPDGRYGWAKLTGERLAFAHQVQGLRVHVVRPFSGYGTDQGLEYPFPAIVARAESGDLRVWGPPGQTRDWIHVSDVVRGALAVVDAEVCDPINLCTGIGTEFGDLARMIARAAGIEHPEPVEYLEYMPTGVGHRVGDPARMLRVYTPRVSIESGIRLALEGSTEWP